MGALVATSRTLLWLPMYIVYAPDKNTFETTHVAEIRTLLNNAAKQQCDAYLSPTDDDTLGIIEEAIEIGSPLELVFGDLCPIALSTIPLICFAGKGSSAFARALVRYALDPCNKVDFVDNTPKDSLLKRQINWLLRYNHYQEQIRLSNEGFYCTPP